jgi:hypothetical protein
MAIDDEVRFGEKYAGSMPTVCREKLSRVGVAFKRAY